MVGDSQGSHKFRCDPYGDARILTSVIPDLTHLENTPMSDFLPLRVLSPIPAPLVTYEDAKTASIPHTPRRQDGTPSPVPAAPRSNAPHNHTNTCLPLTAMYKLLPPEANNGMLDPPRCAPTKPPDPLRADALPRPTTTPCNTQETQGAQDVLFNTRIVLQRRPTFLRPSQLLSTNYVHLLPRPLRLSPDRAAVARDAEI
jgi:hypothetical protein